MKRTFALLILVLVAALAAYSQAVQPNGPPLVTTTQGVQSGMIGGVHDFTPTSALGNHLQSADPCGYCHRPHVNLTDGQAAPLWARKSLSSSATYGVYASPSLDAAAASLGAGKISAINTSNNYSSFCLSCHDGSQYLANAAWGANEHPYNYQFSQGGNYWPDAWADSQHVADAARFSDAGNGTTGGLALTHTHPVNFDYNGVAALDGQLYTASSSSYVWLNTGTTPPTANGRLFNGTMQCSSCHNPHFKTGIGLQGSSSKGALCVACHKK